MTKGDWKIRDNRQGADCSDQTAIRRSKVQGCVCLALVAGKISTFSIIPLGSIKIRFDCPTESGCYSSESLARCNLKSYFKGAAYAASRRTNKPFGHGDHRRTGGRHQWFRGRSCISFSRLPIDRSGTNKSTH